MLAQKNEVITKDSDILGGTPVFRGTRVPFQTLLDYLEGGQTCSNSLRTVSLPTVTQKLQFTPWNMPNHWSSANFDEAAARRMPSKKTQESFAWT